MRIKMNNQDDFAYFVLYAGEKGFTWRSGKPANYHYSIMRYYNKQYPFVIEIYNKNKIKFDENYEDSISYEEWIKDNG